MMLDVNLRVLIPLEVHGRLGNVELAKKYSLMLEWGVPYVFGKIDKRAFQQAKEHSI